MKRKRAKGGGRKPKGEFTQLSSTLTIRIPDDMRKQLEDEAVARGDSMAQRLLWHLRRSFNREGELERHSSIRAFCFLISELADQIRWTAGPHMGKWHSDPFLFRTFKIAVTKLLDTFEPAGEMRPPKFYEPFSKVTKHEPSLKTAKILDKTWRSPQSGAADAVRHVLSDLHRSADEPDKYRQGLTTLANADEVDDWLHESAKFGLRMRDRTDYGMADVRRDLELKAKTTGDKAND